MLTELRHAEADTASEPEAKAEEISLSSLFFPLGESKWDRTKGDLERIGLLLKGKDQHKWVRRFTQEPHKIKKILRDLSVNILEGKRTEGEMIIRNEDKML